MAESPAVARRRIRLALRTAREAKGLTQSQVAEAMEWSLSKVMRIESGDVSVSVSDLRALLPYLDVTNTTEANQLFADAKVARRQRYSVDPQYREHLPAGLLQLMQFEPEATAIRYFSSGLIPGLLQTPMYAAAIFDIYTAGLSDATIKVRMEARLERRDRVFSQAHPPTYLAILDESVLYREIGGPHVMEEQLHLLLRTMADDHVSVRIIPFTAPAPIALLGPFCILDMGDDQDAILYREGPGGDEIVRARRELTKHRDIFDRLWSLAYEEDDSRNLVRVGAEAMSVRAARTEPV